MANWKYTVDIESIWNDESTNVAEKGKLIAGVLKQTFPAEWFDADSESYDDQIDAIYHDFMDVAADDVESFDAIMAELYDYGDCEVAPFDKWPKNRMAWIKTSF